MKVGIVVPYSWSFWGGVVEHAEQQARALEALGVETRILIGHDPPGTFSRALHPHSGRHERPPANVIPLGRSVIAPGNGSLPNIVISPSGVARLWRTLDRERFDLLHVHEPLTPALGVAALARYAGPIVATFHAAGPSSWRPVASGLWGFLLLRIDRRIAVSEEARRTAESYAPGSYELLPNGVELPPSARPGGREHRVVFVGRQEPRKGLPVLLRAWPQVWRRSGARLRLIGADPLSVRLLLTRLKVPEDGIDVLGIVDGDRLTQELMTAKALVAPSLGNESFGMVITRAFACATPVVASDIPAYRALVGASTGRVAPVGDPDALADAIVSMLEHEDLRCELGVAARELAASRYAWPSIAKRLLELYEELTGLPRASEPLTGARL